MKKRINIIVGILFVLFGALWALSSFNIININIFFKGWWTLFIIIPSVIQIIDNYKDKSGYVGLIVGIVLLLATRDIISFKVVGKLVIPFIFVLIGISFIFKDNLAKSFNEKVRNIDNNNLGQYIASFSENRVNLNGDEFVDSNLDACFGTVNFDVTNCNIKEDRYIKASAIFGAVEIKLPLDVNVKVKSSGIFGGTSNKANNVFKEGVPTIYIESFAMFGGVNIR